MHIMALVNAASAVATVGKALFGSKPEAAETGAANTAPAASAQVNLSPAAKQLAGLPPLMLPNPETIQALSGDLNDKLNGLFAANGLSAQPPVSFESDPNTGKISAHGNRSDLKKIEELVNADPALQRQMHDLSAIAGHFAAMQQSAAFNQEYSAAQSPRETDNVTAKYASLLNGPQHTPAITLGYGVDTLQIRADNQTLPG
ncbi:MAG: hypothetical protein AB1400_08930 [Pseudomonadota bacterium]